MRSKYIVCELLAEITKELSPFIERASREAQLLLMSYLQKDELWLITHRDSELENLEELLFWVERRKRNEPLEYITQSVSFYSEEFFIKEGALIPRPETELLIDEVKKHVQNVDTPIRFVEVGIGSGIISIILALYYKNASFIAVDVSQDALNIAKINIEKFGLTGRIELRLGSLLEPVSEEIEYLVSNPPYIKNGIELDSNLSYEPQNALFGGTIGDEIIKELLDEVLRREIKFFSCEFGYDQKDKIQTYLQDKNYKSLEFYRDYSGFDRGFTLKL